MHARACVRSVCICMYICAWKKGIMIIVVGYQTYQLRLYGWVIVEKKKKKRKKTVIYFLRFEVREKARESKQREREGAIDEASLLFSSLIIQYI